MFVFVFVCLVSVRVVIFVRVLRGCMSVCLCEMFLSAFAFVFYGRVLWFEGMCGLPCVGVRCLCLLRAFKFVPSCLGVVLCVRVDVSLCFLCCCYLYSLGRCNVAATNF